MAHSRVYYLYESFGVRVARGWRRHRSRLTLVSAVVVVLFLVLALSSDAFGGARAWSQLARRAPRPHELSMAPRGAASSRVETSATPPPNCTVPVVAFAAFRGAELLKRGVRSARHGSVCRVVIVVNGHEDGDVDRAIEELWAEALAAKGAAPPLVLVVHAQNRGVAASWNAIIESTPEAAYWLILNSDVAFRTSSLDDIGSDLSRTLGGASRVGLTIFGFETKKGLQFGNVAFAISQSTVRAIGLFDENVFPAYYEDDEYKIRMRAAGICLSKYRRHTVIHGEAGQRSYLSGTMRATHRADPFRALVARGRMLNQVYVAQKWGQLINATSGAWSSAAAHHGDEERCDPSSRPAEGFSRPFGDANLPLGFWRLDRDRRKYIETGDKRKPGRLFANWSRSCASNPPQIMVLSSLDTPGARIFTALLGLAGIYTGDQDDLGHGSDSAFQEASDEIFMELGYSEHRLCGYRFEDMMARAGDSSHALRSAVARHNANRPFASFGPQHSILFPAFRQTLSNPVCVIISRDPLEVVAGKQKLKPGRAFALWDLHVTSALRGCADLPTFAVKHADLMQDPQREVERFLRQLNQRCDTERGGAAYYRAALDTREASSVRSAVLASINATAAKSSRKRKATNAAGALEMPKRTAQLWSALQDGSAYELPESQLPRVGRSELCAGAAFHH